jgi:hypothetical protein
VVFAIMKNDSFARGLLFLYACRSNIATEKQYSNFTYYLRKKGKRIVV